MSDALNLHNERYTTKQSKVSRPSSSSECLRFRETDNDCCAQVQVTACSPGNGELPKTQQAAVKACKCWDGLTSTIVNVQRSSIKRPSSTWHHSKKPIVPDTCIFRIVWTVLQIMFSMTRKTADLGGFKFTGRKRRLTWYMNCGIEDEGERRRSVARSPAREKALTTLTTTRGLLARTCLYIGNLWSRASPWKYRQGWIVPAPSLATGAQLWKILFNLENNCCDTY